MENYGNYLLGKIECIYIYNFYMFSLKIFILLVIANLDYWKIVGIGLYTYLKCLTYYYDTKSLNIGNNINYLKSIRFIGLKTNIRSNTSTKSLLFILGSYLILSMLKILNFYLYNLFTFTILEKGLVFIPKTNLKSITPTAHKSTLLLYADLPI